MKGRMIFLPFIYEKLSAVQIGCIDWHYLCRGIIKNNRNGKIYERTVSGNGSSR
jgi:hypothetical protein